MKNLCTFFLVLLSVTAQADPIAASVDANKLPPSVHAAPIQTMSQESNIVPKLLEVTFGLLAILVLIGVAAWAVKRFGRLHIAAKGHLKIIGGMHLGTRERLVLIQVGEKQLLLGVTPGRIDNLHVLDEPIPLTVETHNEEVSFYQKLSTILRTK